jgi:tetratricopeptide (TPR) repeat protein
MARLPLTAADQPVVSPAGSAEVEHALGRLALAGRRVDLAMRHAGAMLLAVPNDPRAHELLALGLRARGDAAGALAAFETAVARGSGGFQPYYEVAAAAHRTASARGRTLEGGEARRIADLYQSALQRYPRHLASYENLAGLLGVVDPLREEDRRWMELGRRLFPESGMIQLGVAQGVRRAGDAARARAMVGELLAARPSPPPETVELANRLLDGWEFEEIGRQIDELGRGGRFRDALAAVEERLAEGVRPGVRDRLLPVREQLRGATLAEDAKRAWEAQEWREARRALAALVDSTAPEPMKEQARRMLAELDQKRPGLPAEAR